MPMLEMSLRKAGNTASETIEITRTFQKQFKTSSWLLPLIKRHRLVNDILNDELKNGIHALSITSKTPAEWDSSSKQISPSPACRGEFENWLFNDAVSTTRLISVEGIGDSEMVFGEIRSRIRHRLPDISLTVGENLGRNTTSNNGNKQILLSYAVSSFRRHYYKRGIRKTTDRLAPIRSVFDFIIKNFQKSYTVAEYCTIDEKLESFRGHCIFRQYINSKPAKYGIKIFELADYRTLYVFNLEIYFGMQPEDQYRQSNSPSDMVKRLITPISGTGRNVTFYNWFMSVPLAKEL
ncbi:hypothetical protein ANN_13145 [Periplaneta americana]|uniref:PiggyBac transposable element-derived protein domain-containing protein n=1 Tax=Periplaneta americana TaxID=6978 RepID=A0ABQ8TKQ2_PERAM|nr:hypothetical protein ANN_13145 [Periplaneta americana]